MAFFSITSRGPVKALQSKFISEVVNLLISIGESAGGAVAVLFRRYINKNKKVQAAVTKQVLYTAGRVKEKAAFHQILPVKVWSHL